MLQNLYKLAVPSKYSVIRNKNKNRELNQSIHHLPKIKCSNKFKNANPCRASVLYNQFKNDIPYWTKACSLEHIVYYMLPNTESLLIMHLNIDTPMLCSPWNATQNRMKYLFTSTVCASKNRLRLTQVCLTLKHFHLCFLNSCSSYKSIRTICISGVLHLYQ